MNIQRNLRAWRERHWQFCAYARSLAEAIAIVALLLSPILLKAIKEAAGF